MGCRFGIEGLGLRGAGLGMGDIFAPASCQEAATFFLCGKVTRQ